MFDRENLLNTQNFDKQNFDKLIVYVTFIGEVLKPKTSVEKLCGYLSNFCTVKLLNSTIQYYAF